MKIIFGLQGINPNGNGGGGAKVIDILFKGGGLKNNDRSFFYFATAKGVCSVDQVYIPLEANSKKISSLKKPLIYLIQIACRYNSMIYLYSVIKEHQFTKQVFEFIEKEKSDEIIIHSFINTGLYSFLKKRKKSMKIKTIVSYHGKGPFAEDLNLKKRTFIYNYVDRRENYEISNADIITFPSKAAMEMFINQKGKDLFQGKRLEVVYNGIDRRMIDSIMKNEQRIKNPSKIFSILNVANHVPQKRFDLIIEICKTLKKHDILFEIINIGEGPLWEKHRQIIYDEGLEKNIKLIGKIPYSDVISQMCRSDIFLMTSENVVFDLSTLEAMYCEMSVIVSKDGGNLEAIDNGKNGFLVENGDIDEFVKIITRLIEKPNERLEIGYNAKRKVIDQFSMEKMSEGYLKLYEQPKQFQS